MDKKMWYTYTYDGFLFYAALEKTNPAICDNMDEP